MLTETEMKNTFVSNLLLELIQKLETLASMRRNKTLTPTQAIMGKKGLQGVNQIAISDWEYLKLEYPDSGSGTFRTAVRYAEELRKLLGDTRYWKGMLEDESLQPVVKTLTTHYIQLSRQLTSASKAESNRLTKEAASKRTEAVNRIPIDPSKSLAYAKNTLELLSEIWDDPQMKWMDVSIALALVTGRRMVEIHQSGQFELIPGNDHQIIFKGQAKGKNRKVLVDDEGFYIGETVPSNPDGLEASEAKFIIETLVDPQLVINGIEFLEYKVKRLDPKADSALVNARYSKQISARLKEVEEWDFIPNPIAGDKDCDITYHKFRGCYLRVALDQVQKHDPDLDVFDFEKIISRLLCDGKGEVLDYYKRYSLIK